MLWTAFLLGFVGSLHCLAMCGPLTLLLPTDKKNYLAFISGKLLYNLGRILTYAALGFLIGLLGQQSSIFLTKQLLSIILGLIILISVLFSAQITRKINLYPSLVKFTSRLKSGFKKSLAANYFSGQLTFGVINGLLPCALVYAALAGSFLQLSPINGANYMALFGLGTLPMMLGISLGSGWLKRHFSGSISKLIPATYLILALWLLYRGLFIHDPLLHGVHEGEFLDCVIP